MLVLCPEAFVNAFLFYGKEQGGVKIWKYLRRLLGGGVM